MIAAFTILHGLVAIALIGAITHQALSVWRTRPVPARTFFSRFRAVPSAGYANAVSLLYILAFIIGSYIYPTYVIDVKTSLAEQGMRYTLGVFQIKEHVAVVGLLLIPAYLHFWRVPSADHVATRRFLTSVMAFCVWYNLVIGHVLNNTRGLS
jgi:hypothetical protein